MAWGGAMAAISLKCNAVQSALGVHGVTAKDAPGVGLPAPRLVDHGVITPGAKQIFSQLWNALDLQEAALGYDGERDTDGKLVGLSFTMEGRMNTLQIRTLILNRHREEIDWRQMKVDQYSKMLRSLVPAVDFNVSNDLKEIMTPVEQKHAAFKIRVGRDFKLAKGSQKGSALYVEPEYSGGATLFFGGFRARRPVIR